MAKIAVDVVLLPSEEMTGRAVEANRELLKQRADRIILDREKCLPHISLAMGCIDRGDIADIEKILQAIAKDYAPGLLAVESIRTETDAAGEEVSVLQVKITRKLQALHEAVMRKLAQRFSYDVTAEMVFSGPAVSQLTLSWIKNYPEESSFEHFSPHITLGYGRLNDFSLPFEFTATQLALCHLGNYCTCRKVLAATELKS